MDNWIEKRIHFSPCKLERKMGNLADRKLINMVGLNRKLENMVEVKLQGKFSI